MNIGLFISKKYFFSRKNPTAINIITAISVLGYLIGSAALIILFSIMNGFENLIFSSYEQYYPAIEITPAKGKVFEQNDSLVLQLKKLKSVTGVSAIFEDNVVIEYDNQQVVATLKGVDSNYGKIVKLDSLKYSGEMILHEKFKTYNGHEDTVVAFGWLSNGIINKLHINSATPMIKLLIPDRESFGVAQQDYTESDIHIAAIIRPPSELDQKLIISSIGFAQELFNRQAFISSIEINCAVNEIENVKTKIKSILPQNNFFIKSRAEQNEAVYKMFKTEKWVAFAIMTFVMLIITFNLIGGIRMLMIEKKQDMRVLEIFGGTKKLINGIFFFEGMFIALCGTIIGIILGLIFVYLQHRFGWIRIGEFPSPAYPVEVRWENVLAVFGMSSLLGIISSLIPIFRSK